MTKHSKKQFLESLFSETVEDFFQNQASPITPAFPNWQKSFISGPASPLFVIEHRIAMKNPLLLLSQVRFKPASEGPPGHVHGGASAALIDESMGIVVWHNQAASLTQSLQLSYFKPLPLNEVAYVISSIPLLGEKTIEVTSIITDQEKTPYVSAQGVFHRLTVEQLQKFISQKNIA